METSTYSIRFVFICLFVFITGIAPAQYLHQGPYFPNMVTEQAFGCLACPGADWSNLNNAAVADNQFASAPLSAYGNCFMTTCYYARALEAENFSFTIPSNALITGIVAEVLRKASAMHAVQDTLVQLMYYGLPIGSSKADTAYWGLNPGFMQYGDSTDLWSNSLLPSQVNSSSFGLFVKPLNKDMVSPFTTAFVDYVSITVYYQLPSGILEHQTSATFPTIYMEENQQALIIKKETPMNGVVSIYNSLGAKIFEQETNNPELLIHTGHFSTGMYLVTLKSGKEFYSKKIMLTRMH